MEAREKTVAFLRLLEEENPFQDKHTVVDSERFTGSSDIFNEPVTVGGEYKQAPPTAEEKPYTQEEKNLARSLLDADLNMSDEQILTYQKRMSEIGYAPINIILSVIESLPEYVGFIRTTVSTHDKNTSQPHITKYVDKIQSVYLQEARSYLM